MMGTAVVFGLCFQTWYMCLRIAYITEMSPTKVRAPARSRVAETPPSGVRPGFHPSAGP